MGQSRKLHYAWLILVSAMVVSAVSSGIRFSFGVFIDPLAEQYGWSRGAISFAYTLQFLAGVPVVLGTGWLSRRFSIRSIVLGGSTIFTIGMLLTATVTQVWQFQVYYGVVIGGIGTSIFTTVIPVTVSRWFSRRLGLAMGLLWSSLSWGPAVFSPVFRWSIETIGWQMSFVVIGSAAGALMLVAALFLRDRPEERGTTPYGGWPREDKPPLLMERASPPTPMSLKHIRATPTFWMLIAVHALGCVAHSIPLAHMVSIATFAGVSSVAAAGMLSLASISSAASRFGFSLLAEARGARLTLTIALLAQTVPILLLFPAKDVWAFYSFALFFGIGYGGEMVGFPIFNLQYYGYRVPLSTIYSYQIAGALLGMALGGWLGGALFDATGAYTHTILAALIAGSLGLIVSVVLPSRNRTTALQPRH